MKDHDFEWDDEKAARNLARHGVSFEAARLAFDDPFAVVREDRRRDYGEDGMVENHLLAVVHTQRERGSGLSRLDWRNHGNDDATMKRTAKGSRKIDWSRVDAMTEAERHAAAMADPVHSQ